jgi:hypothetical protein
MVFASIEKHHSKSSQNAHEVSMDQISKRRRYNIALEMGILYSIIILYTVMRNVPELIQLLQTSGTPLIQDYSVLFSIGETLFISGCLVAFYGLLSLWLADLRFILWAGLGLVVVAGCTYLMGAVTSYQTRGIGPAIPQGGSMFLLSLFIPVLTSKLVMRPRRA